MDTELKECSITQARHDISDLVNRVRYAGERIVLTSRGKPVAGVVSLADLEKLEEIDRQARLHH